MSMLEIKDLTIYGLGIEPPMPEWGALLNAGRNYIRNFSPVTVFRGVINALTLIRIKLFGNAFRDAIDQKLKK